MQERSAEGRCVCVTGSTHGIGYAMAEAFAKAGARLVINSHLADKTALEKLGALTECHFVQADLSTVEGARGLIAEAASRLGRLDTLVNNAGTFRDVDFEDLEPENFERTFNLNVRGYLFVSQAFVKALRPDQENPSIICVGSTNSLAAEKNSVIYDTSKGAVLMMIRSMAVTLARRGVRVNGIGPGIVETPLTRKGLDSGNTRRILNAQIPMGRIGQPDDIGEAAVFLASSGARYITGQMLYIDGGILANQMSWGRTTVNMDLSPRHLQLREMLFRRWKTNGAKVGDKIESQNEIIKFCDFSLITVIKTLKDLEAEGVIRRQVGKGSFLVKTPWTEAHHRIGFFYNRDIVGGGIFNNEFYTKLVVAFEKRVISDGHEFIMGSFTNDKMPVEMWDRLDGVVLTGLTTDTCLDDLARTSSQIAVIDMTLKGLDYNTYRLDFAPAFAQMFDRFGSEPKRYLYLNSSIASSEQVARLEAFRAACAAAPVPQELKVISVNQETGAEETSALHDAIEQFKPDFVCGYMHMSWHARIQQWSDKPIKVYPFGLDVDRPGFVVNSGDWMGEALTSLYAHLDDRQLPPQVYNFPAIFRP